MSNQPRQTALYVAAAASLAAELRELARHEQIAAAREWRATVDALTKAMARARRPQKNRARVARNEGWTPRLQLPGVSGAIFALVWDFIIEGAAAGAARPLTPEDAPVLAEAYRATETSLFQSVRDAREQAGHDEARYRLLRRVALEKAPLLAVAIGYGAMRPSARKVCVVEAVGKEKPAVKIAVLALSQLGHTNAAIARGLDYDGGDVRDVLRLARSAPP